MKYKPDDLIWMRVRVPDKAAPRSWEKGVVYRVLALMETEYICRSEADDTLWQGVAEALRPRLPPDKLNSLLTENGKDDSLRETLIDIASLDHRGLSERTFAEALKEYLGH